MLFEKYEWVDNNFTWVFKPVKKSPVIITVPHDVFSHSDLVGFFKARSAGVSGADKHVWPIVKDVLFNSRVNVVRGLFPRLFVDYNRSIDGNRYGICASRKRVEPAFEDEKLKCIYDFYHQNVGKAIKEGIQQYGRRNCLLMDFHGFIKQPLYGEYDLILGTGNRATVINSTVDIKFARFMSDKGYKIFLPAETSVSSTTGDDFSGDFTVWHYSKKFGIDAIQLEIAKKFRVFEGKDIGEKLASDIAEFFNEYFVSR